MVKIKPIPEIDTGARYIVSISSGVWPIASLERFPRSRVEARPVFHTVGGAGDAGRTVHYDNYGL